MHVLHYKKPCSNNNTWECSHHVLFAEVCVETIFQHHFMCCCTHCQDATHVVFMQHKQHAVCLC